MVTMAQAQRLTIGFLPKVAAELDLVSAKTGLSKANVINRSISLYAFIEAELERGHELLVRREDGYVEKVTIL